MAADLPPGRWSALLVGAWWPAQPDAPMAGVTYWRKAAQLKRNEANDLRNERSRLAVNQGRTADDLLERYWRGEQRLATIAHQCEIKSDQSEQVADTVNYLRDRLTEIAQSGNQQINQILAGKGPIEAKVAAVNAVIEQSNAMADHVGATAMSNIIDATQRVFDETIGGDAHTWLRDHGVSLDTPPPSRPLTADDLTSPTAGSPPEAAAFGSGQPAPGATTPDSGALTAPAATALGSGQSAPGLSLPRSNAPMLSLATPAFGSSQPMPGPPPPCTVSPPLPPSAPAVGVGGPSVPAAGMPPAAATAPLSPQSLGQSFTTGMTTGTPAAAGAQALSAGVVHAATEPLPPPAPPPTTPTVTTPTVATATTAGIPHIPDSAPTPSPAPIAPPTTDNASAMTPIAPMVANGPPASPAPPGRRPRGATARLRRRPAPTGNHTPCHATHPNRTHLRCRGHTLLTRSRRLTNVTRRQQIHRTSHHPGPTQQPNTTASQRHRGRHHRRRSRRHLPPSRRTTTPTPHPRHRRPPRTRIIVGCRATRQRPNHPAGHRPRQRLDPPTHSPTRPHHPARTGPPTPPRHRHRPTGHHHRSRGTPPPRLPQPTRPRHTRTHRRPHSTHRTHNRRTRTHPGRNGTPPRHTAPHRPSRSSGRHPQLRRPRQRNRPPTPQNHRDPPSRTDHLPQPRHRHGGRLDAVGGDQRTDRRRPVGGELSPCLGDRRDINEEIQMTSIESHPEQYWAAAGRPGPVPLALGPVHPGGPTLIDLLMALFGLSTNADLGGTNADIEGDDTDRRAHAADAARKFSANEANAAEQMQGVGAQGMAQMASGIGGALSGALGGVMGPLTQLPQQAMQAGQGAMQPLMSAMQQAQGADGLAAVDGARLLDSIGGEPGLGSGAGGGDVGGGGAGGTTPTGYLGPPPVPTSSPPTTPAGAPTKSATMPPPGGASPASAHMGAAGMPMVPPGAMGARGEGSGQEKPVEKRVTAPAVPNGQPVKGRLTVPPSAPTTKPTDGKPVVRRRILLPEHKDFGRIAPDEKTDAGE
ncbi:conserved hypothetical protein [Mycobacterium tuberculosis CPHL_A]|nr:conserved hypothetical protein [Mycobacterium tuberculosis CPHL_A]